VSDGNHIWVGAERGSNVFTVAILINGSPIFARSAVNRGKVSPGSEECLYEVDTGEEVLHDPDDGAVKLARKLLDTIREQM